MGYSLFIQRIRRNHALEHATMHLLSRSNPALRLIGRSDWAGFSIYGDVDTQLVLRALTEGLARLKHHESWLALHPRCGTNIAVSALLSGSAVYFALLLPLRSRFFRMLTATIALITAMVVARPLGQVVQRHVTTMADMEGVRVKLVRRELWGNTVIHHITVAHDSQAESYVLHLAR
jgi:hypothetical protein